MPKPQKPFQRLLGETRVFKNRFDIVPVKKHVCLHFKGSAVQKKS